MSHHTRTSSIEDVTPEDVYHAIAHDPETIPGIYLDQVTATPYGLTVTLCDELDRSATYLLAVARTQGRAPQPAGSNTDDAPFAPSVMTEQDRKARVRAVSKAEALIEAACDVGGPAADKLNRRAWTYLRQAARLHPLAQDPDEITP